MAGLIFQSQNNYKFEVFRMIQMEMYNLLVQDVIDFKLTLIAVLIVNLRLVEHTFGSSTHSQVFKALEVF